MWIIGQSLVLLIKSCRSVLITYLGSLIFTSLHYLKIVQSDSYRILNCITKKMCIQYLYKLWLSAPWQLQFIELCIVYQIEYRPRTRWWQAEKIVQIHAQYCWVATFPPNNHYNGLLWTIVKNENLCLPLYWT